MTAPTPSTRPLIAVTGITVIFCGVAVTGATGAAVTRQPAAGYPAAVTAAQQARALRYWTAARMAGARPPSGAAGVARAVVRHTAAAGWPGGGLVARATGKVFFTMEGQDYVCSGSVVAGSDVVITAAHCVKNGVGAWAVNWTFVPGFTQGNRPYGTWTARRYFVPRQWARRANDNDDFAFVTLNPLHLAGRTLRIGQVAGGEPIRFGARTPEEFVFGYPSVPPYDGRQLYYCSGHVARDAFHGATDAGLRCVLTAGTSGGPWLSGFHPATGTGVITSVSSFKYSADPATLYGPPLGAVARALFLRARHASGA